MEILVSRYVLPISSPPIDHGAVAIDSGRIAAVGPASSILKRFPSVPVRRLGGAAVLPGLINVHTHLQFTHFGPLRRKKPGGRRDFISWLLRLAVRRKARQALTGSRSFLEAFSRGMSLAAGSGTTCVADITDFPESRGIAARSGLRAVIYYEAIGLDPAAAEDTAAGMDARVEAHRRDEGDGSLVSCGVSPHTPYTVSPALFRKVAQIARSRGIPLAVHVAESADEVEFTRNSAGGFVRALFPLAGWSAHVPPPMGLSPAGYLHGLGILRRGTLAVHAVHVSDDDIRLFRETGTAVAHCPRSNRFLGVGTAPLKKFLDSGIPVGLGTDSLASNASLSLWDEMRCAREIHGLDGRALLRLATAGGAGALGLSGVVGSLDEGKSADIIAVNAERTAGGDIHDDLVASVTDADVRLVMVAGKTPAAWHGS